MLVHPATGLLGRAALLLCLASIALAACQTNGGSSPAASERDGAPAAPEETSDGERAAAPSQPGLTVTGRIGDPVVPAPPSQVQPAAERPESPQGIVAFVTRVVNGDTIEVLFENGTTETVRLVGVDAPERPGGNQSHRFEGVADSACLDDWGSRAQELATTTLEGRYVDLVPDRSPRSRGFYERLLVYLHVDSGDFNAQLVEEGYARVYEEGESRRKEEYLVLQEEAQAEGVGLWGCRG